MHHFLIAMAFLFTISSNASVSSKVIAGTIANACFVQGTIKETGRSFDIGIGGEGWIPLLSSQNVVVYTRYGALGMDQNGQLVHLSSGYPVVTVSNEGKINIINLTQYTSRPFSEINPSRKAILTSMIFTEEGSLEGIYSNGQATQIAKLKLATFENPSKLVLIDAKMHLFSAPAAVGEVAYGEAETAPFGKIFARALEEVPTDRYTKKCD